MKKLILLLTIVVAFGCSKDEKAPDIEYGVELRDKCLTDPETVYTQYELEKDVYEDMRDISPVGCPVITFTDIDGNEVTGILSRFYSTE